MIKNIICKNIVAVTNFLNIYNNSQTRKLINEKQNMFLK